MNPCEGFQAACRSTEPQGLPCEKGRPELSEHPDFQEMQGISIPKGPLEFKMKLNENMQLHHGSRSTSWPQHPLLVDLAAFQWAGGLPFDLEAGGTACLRQMPLQNCCEGSPLIPTGGLSTGKVLKERSTHQLGQARDRGDRAAAHASRSGP